MDAVKQTVPCNSEMGKAVLKALQGYRYRDCAGFLDLIAWGTEYPVVNGDGCLTGEATFDLAEDTTEKGCVVHFDDKGGDRVTVISFHE